ncbi:MAG: hypothetical protein DA394_04605 [Candidatus Arcticimaribacter sp.]|nr:MAG: hypothetical protein DA394_04605 [Candidatus Arcticimaribacter sp.]
MERLIVLYFEKRISSEERKELEEALKQEDVRLLFKAYAATYALINSNSIKEEALPLRVPKRNRTIIRFSYAVAATLVLSLLIRQGFWNQDVNQTIDPNKIILAQADGTINALDEVDLIKSSNGNVVAEKQNGALKYSNDHISDPSLLNTLYVPKGKTFEIILSDGSAVFLNSDSKLSFPNKFLSNEPRRVQVEGEAFFKIAKDSLRPFIVSSERINTEVFGTEFVFSSYKEDEQSEVILIEGSVGVFADGTRFDELAGVYLKPHNKVSVSKSAPKKLEVSKINVEDYIAWKTGILVFEKESFASILLKLERKFNVEFENHYTELNDKKFTGRFEFESLEAILTTIQASRDFNYTIDQEKIIITKPKANE